MRITDLLSTAFLNLWRRKLRAFLTVLGMVIGTASIVVMVSLGIGIKEATVEAYAGTGSLTMITVNSWKWTESAGGNGGSSTETELNSKSVKAFEEIPGVVAVMPRVETYGILKSGKYVTDANIIGIDEAVAGEFGFELASGELPKFVGGSTYEMVVGAWTLNNFYDPKTYRQAIDHNGNSLITEDSRFQLTFDYNNIYDYGGEMENYTPGKYYRVNITGAMSDSNNEFGWYCVMDIEALKRLARENKDFMNLDFTKYQTVMVKCENIEDVRTVKAQIDEMGYGTYSLTDAIDMAEEQTKSIQFLLGAIGGVSLFVAAIGIMNTMMMSIYERTKEIGIIKVLGCRMSNIAGLFLTESAYIGLFGGAIGIGLSYGLGLIINSLVQDSTFRSVIPGYLAIGAVAFSIVVAVVSGFYPAMRAMRLSPLTAIRNE